MKKLKHALALGLLILVSAPVYAIERIAEFRGDRSMETREFEVQAPFLVDWIANSEYPGSMGLVIALIDARTGTHEGYILKTKYRGNGLRLVEESGTYRFRIDSTFTDWQIRVDEITREEAEQYKPKQSLDY